MTLQDINEAGAFIDKGVWDNFIIKPDGKVRITPTDYTRK